MAQTIMALFKSMLVIMLFYSFCITTLTYTLNTYMPESLNYVTSFSDTSNRIDLETVSGEVENSLEAQTNIPVIELGALVFYSGNILIDLLLNFAFAIPEMLGLLVHGITTLLNFDNYLFVQVQVFFSVIVMVMYVIGIIQLLTGIRSGRVIT